MSKDPNKLIPFTNSIDFLFWHDNNCAKCRRYENKSMSVTDANCIGAFYLDLGSLTGFIPTEAAEFIGYTPKNPDTNLIQLDNPCKKFKPCRKQRS